MKTVRAKDGEQITIDGLYKITVRLPRGNGRRAEFDIERMPIVIDRSNRQSDTTGTGNNLAQPAD